MYLVPTDLFFTKNSYNKGLLSNLNLLTFYFKGSPMFLQSSSCARFKPYGVYNLYSTNLPKYGKYVVMSRGPMARKKKSKLHFFFKKPNTLFRLNYSGVKLGSSSGCNAITYLPSRKLPLAVISGFLSGSKYGVGSAANSLIRFSVFSLLLII